MPALKTLLVSDEPRVLLIGAPAWVTGYVSTLFTQHEMRVVTLTELDFLEVNPQTIDPAGMYKVIWWADFSRFETHSRVRENIAQLKEIPLVVLGSVPEEFLFEQEKTPEELQARQQLFVTLLDAFPKAQFFFARDLFSPDELREPFRFSWKGISQGMLFDPGEKWFLSTRESFFEVVCPALVRPPTPRRVIVRGRSALSSTYLKKCADLSARYYHLSLEVTPILARRSPPSLTGFVQTAVPVEIGPVLDEFIRQKDLWEKALLLPAPISLSRLVKKTSPPSSGVKNDDTVAGRTRARVNEGKRLINQIKINTATEEQEEEKIEGELARIFQSRRSEQKEERIDNKVKIVKRIAKKSRKNKALFWGGMGALSLGGVVLALWLLFLLSTALAKREIHAFLKDISPSSPAVYAAGPWTTAVRLQATLYTTLLGEGWTGEGGDVVNFETVLQRFQTEKQHAMVLGSEYALGVLGRGDTSFEFPPELAESLGTLASTENELIQTAERIVPASWQGEDQRKAWLDSLQQEQQQLLSLSQFPEVLTELFGGNGKKIYAVLLQNNLELRATGGFIQAVGLLVFDNGLLIDSQVLNTYDLDNRILGSISAPAEVKKYLGEDAWYLRDSNWNPDYPLSAQRAAWFIREATGVSVDGVWGVNYLAFQNFLDALGPLEVSTTNEVLTANNLLERVEFHSDEELSQAGAKGYAQTLFTEFLQELQKFPPEKTPAFLESILAGLEGKQIFLYLTQEESQAAVQKIGWSGEVVEPQCPSQFSQKNCFVDQIFQVESNVGLNRVNGYIRREVQHKVDLSGEKVSHVRTVTLENTARSQGWPLGTYKAYIRFLLDADAQPTSVTVNGKKTAGESLMLYGEEGRRVVGVPVEVPPQSKTTLELEYTTEKLPNEALAFLLFDQQQAGIGPTSTTLTLYNPGKKAVLIAPAAKLYGDTVEFSLSKSDHLFAGASYQR